MSYFVFAGEDYYPAGGWRDFRSEHPTLPYARIAAGKLRDGLVPNDLNCGKYDWIQIVDGTTHTIVEFWTIERGSSARSLEGWHRWDQAARPYPLGEGEAW